MLKIRKVLSKLLMTSIVMLTMLQTGVGVHAEVNTSGGVVAYYKFEGDFSDSSGNGLDGTAVGEVSFTDGVVGQGAKFEGGYVEVPHNEKLLLDKGYTISAWIYTEDVRPERVQPIVAKLNSSVWDVKPAYQLFMHDRYLQMEGWLPGMADSASKGSKGFIDFKRWTMITVTSDGEFLRCYIDGKLIDNIAFNAVFPSSTGKLVIGFGDIYGGSRYFKGVMDSLTLYDYPLSSQTVKGTYEELMKNEKVKNIVKRPNQLISYYRFDGDLKDYSGYGNDAEAIQTGEGFAYTDGVIGKGLKFKGNSYLQVNDSSIFDFEKGFTMSAWIYNNNGPEEENQPIIQKLGPSMVDPASWPAFFVNEFRHVPTFSAYNENNSADDVDFNSGVESPSGKWHMLTVTSNGTSVKYYIDSVLKATKNEKVFIPNSSGKLLIGQNCFAWDEKGKFFEGVMDEVKIFNYELSYNDVKGLYDLKDGIIIKPYDIKLDLTKLKLGQNIKKNQQLKLRIALRNIKYEKPKKTYVEAPKLVPLINTTSDITSKVKYTSSNPKVAKVTTNGIIIIVEKGQATITATYGNYKATQTIIVK